MSSKKSGARRRKEKKEEEDQTAKLRKLDTFFAAASSRSSDSVAVAHGPLATGNAAALEHIVQEKNDSDPFDYSYNNGSDGEVVNDNESQHDVGDILQDSDEREPTRILSEFHNDPAQWPEPPTESLRKFWAWKGKFEQNISNRRNFKETEAKLGQQYRSLTMGVFYRSLHNREKKLRSWLIYSPECKAVFCGPCKLFSPKRQLLTTKGLADWGHISKLIREHENGKDHIESVCAFASQCIGSTVDVLLAKDIEKEETYWKEILRRVISVIKLLAERGLAFRGENEIPHSPNNGNFLGILDLLAEYDPMLAKHMELKGHQGRGRQHYLSSTICDELIVQMAQSVLDSIIADLKQAKYYSISIDSTPDLAHVDQLTFIARFVGTNGPVERFMSFIPVGSKTGENLASVVTSFLANHKILIADCRGQSYDNASNMAGPYRGVQSRILELNHLASFVPCAGHSLNLVGENAANCNDVASKFFGFVQELYNFLSASTNRWAVLIETLSEAGAQKMLVVKNPSKTRWSAHYDALRSLSTNYKWIELALQRIGEDAERFDRQSRFTANNLAMHLEDMDIALMTVLWARVLERFHANSLVLQKEAIDLSTAVGCYKSLITFTEDIKTRFDEFEAKALSLLRVSEANYREDTQRRKSCASASERRSPREKYVSAVNEIIDCLTVQLNHRLSAYDGLYGLFEVLTHFPTMSTEKIRHSCDKLVDAYRVDFDHTLGDEFVQFANYVKSQLEYANATAVDPVKMLQLIRINDLGLFANFEVAYRIFLCMMVANCTGERTFSKLKRIKNELRATMTQSRLNSLALLAINVEKTRALDFEDVVIQFAKRKARKRKF